MDWLSLKITCLYIIYFFHLKVLLTTIHVSGIVPEAMKTVLKGEVMAHTLAEFVFLLGRWTTQQLH